MLAAAQAQKVPKIMRDKDGKPYVGDTIPPDKLPQGPTQDEAKYMDTLETLRDQQLRQLKTQREYDLWLQTFTSDDALEKGWASKYKPDYQGIDEFESKLTAQRRKLKDMEDDAARLDRSGKSADPESTDMTRKIADLKLDLVKWEEEKIKLARKMKSAMEKDTQRYHDLKHYPVIADAWVTDDSVTGKKPIVSTFTCLADTTCGRAWELSLEYVKSKTADPVVATGSLIQTAVPRHEKTFSIVANRITGTSRSAGEQTIFLEVRCWNISAGTDLCNSEQVERIRSGFTPYLEQSLGKSQQ